MQCQCISPDAAICARVLKAYACAGAVQKGKQMHAIMVFACLGSSSGRNEEEALVVALVEMYAKCGLIRNAREIFDRLEIWSLALRMTLMAAYAQWGQDEAVMRMLDAMVVADKEGIEPDKVTFAIVLNAFCQSGLVEEAIFCIVAMVSSYHICPAPEHCTCMVDAFGRAGQLDRALAFVEAVPIAHCPTAWAALLGACKNCANLDLGSLALRHSVELDGDNATAYVCMINMYSSSIIAGV
jgi:pentatricopeptide repeat protein